MDVYKFEKTLLERMDEFLNVLSWKDESIPIPASRVKNEWAYYIELQIEPAGWQALWKIPRVICEEMKIKYPTFVFGMIQQVLFKELKAIFEIIAVQDEDVHLPEKQEVQLEDLWVTKEQENTEMNIEKTAELLDSLRFFYNNIWMPWDYDNDDDLDWPDKYLETRIRFYYDLKTNSIKKSIVNHIKNLLIEAHYLQNRREYLELSFQSDDEAEENEGLERNKIIFLKDLMRVHLRLSMIRNKIEILENPAMREIYEEFDNNENENWQNCDVEKAKIFIVAKPGTLNEHIELLNKTKDYVSSNKTVKMCPKLQDALNVCNLNDTILLSPGKHHIKFLEHFNGNNSVIGINSTELNEFAEITSKNDESILLVFDGDYTLKNITLDCKNMNTGVYIKNCNVTFENCNILGNENLSNTQGIILFGNAKLKLKNCFITNFSSGIVLNNNSKLILTESNIQLCGIGIELSFQNEIDFHSTEITNCKNFAISCEIGLIKNKILESEKKIFEDLEITKVLNPPWKGKCLFKGNIKGNVLLKNNENLTFHTQILRSNNSNCLEDFLNGSIEDVDLNDTQSCNGKE